VTENAPRHGAGWAAVTLACGLLAGFAQVLAGFGAAALIGAALASAGLSMLAFAWRAQALPNPVLRLLFPASTLVAGGVALSHPGSGGEALAALAGAWFFADGVASMIVAWNVKPAGGWGWLTLAGGGAVALAYLALSGWPVGPLVGVRLAVLAIAMWALGAAGARR